MPKKNLPTLLDRLMNTLQLNSHISSFHATGNYPLDRNEVLKRLPGTSQDQGGIDAASMLNNSVAGLLKENLGIGGNEEVKEKSKRHKSIYLQANNVARQRDFSTF